MHRSLLPLVTLLAGCGAVPIACTEIGCTGSLTLSFTGRTWDDGASYTLTVSGEFDGEPCVLTLPDVGCDGQTVAVDGDTLTVGVRMPMGTPDEVHVLLETDDSVVHDGDHAVDWGEPFYPNGRACDGRDGGCAAGEAIIAL